MKRRLSALVVLMLLMPFLITSTAIAKGSPEIVIIADGAPVMEINPSTGLGQVPDDPPITYTVNGYTVVRPSEMGPLTGTVNDTVFVLVPLTGADPVQARGPGHDYGAIYSGSEPALSVSPANAISYTVNGYTIVRRSEMGPLTGTVNNPLPAVGPGHDYGGIGNYK